MDYGNVACSNCESKLSSKRITFKRGDGVKMQMLRYECKCGVKDCKPLGEIEFITIFSLNKLLNFEVNLVFF